MNYYAYSFHDDLGLLVFPTLEALVKKLLEDLPDTFVKKIRPCFAHSYENEILSLWEVSLSPDDFYKEVNISYQKVCDLIKTAKERFDADTENKKLFEELKKKTPSLVFTVQEPCYSTILEDLINETREKISLDEFKFDKIVCKFSRNLL
jgi:hypothetical protein